MNSSNNTVAEKRLGHLAARYWVRVRRLDGLGRFTDHPANLIPPTSFERPPLTGRYLHQVLLAPWATRIREAIEAGNTATGIEKLKEGSETLDIRWELSRAMGDEFWFCYSPVTPPPPDFVFSHTAQLAGVGADDYALLLDGEGHVLWASRRVRKYVPASCEPLGWLCAEADPESVAYLKAALHRETEIDLDLPLRGPGGEIFIFAANLRPLAFSTDEVWGYLLRLEKRQPDTSRLRATSRDLITLLAGGLAHDFNNYLGGIRLGLDRLAWHHPSLTPSIDLIRHEVDAARHLASRLMRLSRNPEPLALRAVPVSEAIRNATAIALSGSATRLTINLESGELHVLADPVALEQILLNLLINAREAMQGKGAIHIATETRWNDQGSAYVRITVSDNGPGIPPDVRKRLFEPFISNKPNGTGLGLFTSLSLAKEMSGTLALLEPDTPDDSGSTFTLDLPLAEVLPREGPTELSASGPSPVTSAARQVVLLDDNSRLLRLASGALEAMGIEVRPFDNAAEFSIFLSQEAKAFQPDAFIMDLTLPGGDGGLEFLPEIRSAFPKAIVILTSGHTERQAALRAHTQEPLVHFLPKPFPLDELARILGLPFVSSRNPDDAKKNPLQAEMRKPASK